MEYDSIIVFEDSLDSILYSAKSVLCFSSELQGSIAGEKTLSSFTQWYDEFDDITEYINNIKNQDVTETEDGQYQICQIIELSESIREILFAMKAVTRSMNTLLSLQECNYVFLNTYLTSLSLFRLELEYYYQSLKDIYEQDELLWDSLKTQEEEEEEEDACDITESYMYIELKSEIDELLGYYIENNPRVILKDFHKYVMESLDKFAIGEYTRDLIFDFTYSYKGETRSISFQLEDNSITITTDSVICYPGVGPEGHTDWMFTLWNNGCTSDRFISFLDLGRELIDSGAKLCVSEPDQYAGWNEKYTRCVRMEKKHPKIKRHSKECRMEVEMDDKEQKVMDTSGIRRIQEILRKEREAMTPEEKEAWEARIQELLRIFPQL